MTYDLHSLINPFPEVISNRWNLAILAACSYLIIVRTTRYARRDNTARRFGYHDRASWSQMTLKDAYEIQLPLAQLEFPTSFSISVFFALFKTYGIPSISKLLVSTGQLSSPTTASKRAADTGVIITEVVLNEPESDRAIDGIALMNYLHGRYRKAGKISNDDMLYTLSLFMLEPIRWTSRFEWRHLTDLERCAMGVYWKDLGEAMEISYDRLPSSASGWHDGLHWLEEVEAWSLAYEKENMVPAVSNEELAKATFDIALFNFPKFLKPIGYQIASSPLEPRLLKAMRLPEPPAIYGILLNILVEIRRFLLRHFFLPRPHFWRAKWFTEPNPQTGRINFCRYVAHPWYIRPSLSARWGWKAWALWLVGGAVPGSPEYLPEGYLIPELGPTSLTGKGESEMAATRRELKSKRGGCIFAHPPK